MKRNLLCRQDTNFISSSVNDPKCSKGSLMKVGLGGRLGRGGAYIVQYRLLKTKTFSPEEMNNTS